MKVLLPDKEYLQLAQSVINELEAKRMKLTTLASLLLLVVTVICIPHICSGIRKKRLKYHLVMAPEEIYNAGVESFENQKAR